MERIVTPSTPPQHDIESQQIGFAPHSPTTSDTSTVTKETKRANVRLYVWLSYARFLMQVIISISVLLFTLLQLAFNKNMAPEDKIVYFANITLVFAAWMPSPKLPTDSSNSK